MFGAETSGAPDVHLGERALFHGMTLLAIDGLLIPEKVGANPLEGALQVLLEGLSRADTAGSD